MDLDPLNIITSIVEPKPPTKVKPREFFIAWNGVATLAYRWFSRTLLDIKAEIEGAVPGMKQENLGARWPKTTLGALRDDRTLSWNDAYALRDICDKFEHRVNAEPELNVQQLSLVVFQCRSLERRLLTRTVSLGGSVHEDDTPPEEHVKEVEETMATFSRERLSEYIPRMQAPGNRESHYRGIHIEPTLVFDLNESTPKVVQDFIEAVNEALPGAYCWFEPRSFHMTVRGLV